MKAPKLKATREEIEAFRNSEEFQKKVATAEARAAGEPANAAEARALAVPLPGGLVDAMEPSAVKRLGLTFQPVVAAQIGLLQKMDTGFYRKIFVDKTVKVTVEDMAVALFVFTVPAVILRKLLRDLGNEGFIEAAQVAIADKVPPWDLPLLETDLVKHMEASLEARVGLASDALETSENPLVPPALAKP